MKGKHGEAKTHSSWSSLCDRGEWRERTVALAFCEHQPAMPRFNADVVFEFEAETVEAAGAELRRLALAARSAGFELKQGRVEPRSMDDDEGDGWTSYGPLDEPSA